MSRSATNERERNSESTATSVETDYDIRRCNQFILGPTFVDKYSGWKRITAGPSWRVTAHPSLNVLQETLNEKFLTLIGFILDPQYPEATDASILRDLLVGFDTFSNFLDEINRFGGRWIIIIYDGKSTKLIHDACGLRQVFYARADTSPWCASQPELIGEVLGFKVDREADGFFRLQLACVDQQAWWPGNSSAYGEIRHLLPNHYLDLDSVSSHRYWPKRDCQSTPFDEAVKNVGQILRGTTKAAAHRFDLCLSLTAGYDSRCVLAACKEFADKISCSTTRLIGEPSDNLVDVEVAHTLAERLGFKHDVIQSPMQIDDKFFDAYVSSVRYPHLIWYPNGQAWFNLYQRKKVELHGCASEIGRCFYGFRQLDITNAGKALASMTNMGWHPFAIRHFQSWFNDVGDTKGYSLLDLFYWENRVGNWLAMCQAEGDVSAKDIIAPFNCRNLLTQMLGVSQDKRAYPKYLFHRELISSLWKAALAEPINPHKPVPSWLRSRLSFGKRLVKSGISKIANFGSRA